MRGAPHYAGGDVSQQLTGESTSEASLPGNSFSVSFAAAARAAAFTAALSSAAGRCTAGKFGLHCMK